MSFSDLLCFITLILGLLFISRSDKTLIIIALLHKMSGGKLLKLRDSSPETKMTDLWSIIPEALNVFNATKGKVNKGCE